MIKAFRALVADRRGATAIEYGLIVALIVVGIIGVVGILGGQTGGMWQNITTKVSAVTPAA